MDNTRREGTTSKKLLHNLNLYTRFTGKPEVRLKDPQLGEKIKETVELAKTLESNFKENYKTVRMEINVIHRNVMQRLETDKKTSDRAKKYYRAVCSAYTFSNSGSRSGTRTSHYDQFKDAVRDYLDFVQGNNISHQGKRQAIENLLPHLPDVPRDNPALRDLVHELKTLPDVQNKQDVIEIPFSNNDPEKDVVAVYTGGTIGSVLVQGEILQPSEAKKKYPVEAKDMKLLLSDEYKRRFGDQNKKIIDMPIMETLSENMTIKKKVELAKKLKDILESIDPEKCDGIVLTHGSDTLGHTANFLALLLADMKLKVPVVLVSSNYVVTDKKANGIENFKAAVDFLSHVKLPPNVYVTENSKFKDEIKVILASRVTQCQSITDNYRSTSIGKNGEKSMRPLGVIRKDKFTVFDKELYEKLQARKPDDRPSFNLIDRIDALEKARVLWIEHPYPGLDYSFYNIDEAKDVLHGTYHGGSACTKGEEENILKFAEKCREKGKKIYYGPFYGSAHRDVYGSTKKILDPATGIRSLMNLSPEMALEKLRFSQLIDNEEERERFLYSDINCEFVLPDTEYLGPMVGGATLPSGSAQNSREIGQ